MIPSNDPFWDVLKQEQAQERSLRVAIDKIEREVALAQRILALRSAPGFKEFQNAIDSMRAAQLKRLTEDKLSDTELRELRGRVQAYGEFLKLLSNAERSIEQLDGRLSHYQNDLNALLKRRPQEVNR